MKNNTSNIMLTNSKFISRVKYTSSSQKNKMKSPHIKDNKHIQIKINKLKSSEQIQQQLQQEERNNLLKQKQIHIQKDTIKILTDEIEKARKELLNTKKDISRLESIHDSKKKDLDELISKLSKTNESIEALQKENNDLQRKIFILQNNLSQRQNQRQNNIEQIRSFRFLETLLLSQILNSVEEDNEVNGDVVANIDNMTYEELLELEEKIGNVSKGLNNVQIKKLPIDLYKKGKYNNDKCIICQYEYKLREKVKLLPCKHIFHPECIDEWLKNEKKCPFCKSEVN